MSVNHNRRGHAEARDVSHPIRSFASPTLEISGAAVCRRLALYLIHNFDKMNEYDLLQCMHFPKENRAGLRTSRQRARFERVLVVAGSRSGSRQAAIPAEVLQPDRTEEPISGAEVSRGRTSASSVEPRAEERKVRGQAGQGTTRFTLLASVGGIVNHSTRHSPNEIGGMFESSGQLVRSPPLPDPEARSLLSAAGFADSEMALRRLREIAVDSSSRDALAGVLPLLLVALSDAATPDASLVNFERYVQCVPNRVELLRYLASKPRAVEILVKLFVGSQFLTEILLRNPDYLEKLTNHKRIAEFKSRQQFCAEAREAADGARHLEAKLDALRRYQRWELLRIGACDAFGLLDLKSVTVELSVLADSLVQ